MSDENGVYEEYAYDEEFQKKVLSLMVNDLHFLTTQAIEAVRPVYFSDKNMKLICKWIFDYYAQYQDTPTMSTLINTLNKYSDKGRCSEEDAIEMNSIIISIFEAAVLDSDYIRDEISDFAVSQEVKAAIMQAVEIYQSNDLEKIKSIPAMFDKAVSTGQVMSPGLSMKDLYTVQEKLRKAMDPARIFKTHLDQIDDAMLGGFVPGVHLFVGRPGVGKSTVLTHMLCSALYQGKKALYVTCELSEFDVLVKAASRVSGMPHDEILLEANEPQLTRAFDRIGKLKGDFRIKFWENKSASTNTIQAYLNKLKGFDDFKPDVIIVDYADLLKPNLADSRKTSQGTYEDMGEVFYELNSLAVRFNCPVITASQPVRSAWFLPTIELEHLADSAKKAHVAYSVWSINQTREEEEEGLVRFFGAKVRKGKTGKTAWCNINKGIAHIRNADKTWPIAKDVRGDK